MIREYNIIKEQIKLYDLDLTDLTVITECASGYYAYNTFVPLLAKAKKVVAVSKTTKYGTFEENKENIYNIAKKLNIDLTNLEIVEKLEDYHLKQADIITNSGLVRPITREMIKKLKRTCVIPLMWETWEFRDTDLDLKSCIENDILVLGTDESHPNLKMYPIGGILGISLLLKLGLEVYKSKVILFGDGILGNAVAEAFDKNGVEYIWFVEHKNNENQYLYKDIEKVKKYIPDFDAMIFAEHKYTEEIISPKNNITFQEIFELNREIKIGVIAGNINKEELEKSKLKYYPKEIMPVGYMSYQPYHLGPRPVIELFSCSMKVAEVMAKCRKNGMSLEETIKYSLENSPAMDFIGKTYMDRYKEIKSFYK